MSSSSAVAMSADPIHSRPPSAAASSSSTPPPPRSVPPCACCGHARPDVVVSGCPGGCAYHARCLDLAALIRAQGNTTSHGKSVAVHRCPGCGSSCNGLAMLPLDFREMDAAQKGTSSSGGRDRSAPSSSSSGAASSSGGAAAPPSSGGNKRLHDQLLTSGAERDGSYYDPNVHRVGKWSPEEIAFRDELIPHFVEGNLPLNNGLKLIDFLSRMLKSKPSRLTKKMKHARLSTRHFHTDIGFIPDRNKAAYLSALEDSFVNSIGDAVERTEIRFHMGREWRDHIAERLTYMRIGFDASEWLRSVDVMERRIALATNRNRMVRRRFMMGKAMEKDMSTPTHGVFIEQTPHDAAPHHDEVDFELLASALETSDGDDGDLLGVYADMSAATPGESPGGRPRDADDGGMDVDPSPANGNADPLNRSRRGSSADAETAFRSHVLPSVVSSSEPNFKLAAPFLSKITAYVEHNRIPFECADIWVPSEGCPSSSSSSGGEATGNPPAATRGSGCERSAPGVTGRLCFAGSAVVNVQVANDDDVLLSSAATAAPSSPSQAGGSAGGAGAKRVVPLTGDEVYNLSLFGNYSEKFSFLPGCGLPGRVYESGVPAWEQFVANAPAHLFERRGGAVQFGIKTALGMPVASPTVGRVVVVLYSRHNRIKDDGLVAQMMGDFRGYSPTPQWKLVVEVTSPGAAQGGPQQGQGQQQQVQAPQQRQKAPAAFAALAESNAASQAAEAKGDEESRAKVRTIISLLGENMPSDPTTPLGSQIDNIMGLRFVLLKSARTPHEEQLVDSILTLHDSYVEAGRSRPEITMMLARDWQFHSVQQPPPSHAPPPAVCQQPVSGLLAAQHHQHQQLMGHAPLGLHSMNHAAPSHQPMVSAMSNGSLPSMMGGSIPALQHLSIQSGGAVRRTSGSGFGGAVSAFNALSHQQHQHHQQQQEAVVHLEHTHHGAPTPSVPIPVGGNPPPPPRPSSFPPAAASVLGSSYPGRARGGALGASLMERNYSDRSGGAAAAPPGGSPPGPEPLAGGGGGADMLMERDYSGTNFASPSPETHGPRSADDGPAAARAEVPSAAKVEDDETVDAEG